MLWEGVAAVIALVISIAGAAYSVGFLGGSLAAHEKEIERARDRIDEMERAIRDIIRRDHTD